jgi:hypothetical protein
MIPRHFLPQIPSDKYDEFCTFLRGRGVSVRLVRLPVAKLKAIQSEVKREKVDHFKRNPQLLAKPVIVSKSGFILDGHHRWLAQMELDPKGYLLTLECDCSIRQLVHLGHEFDGSFVKTVHEGAMYGLYN